MSASRSLRVFGVYLLVLGCALMVVPNLVLAPFGFPPTSEIWLRVVGVLVVVLGYYYHVAASLEVAALYRATVFARLFVVLSFAAFVFAGLVRPTLLLFGAIDLLGAAWTFAALRAGEQTLAT